MALLKYDLPVTSEAFCLQLLQRPGVMFTPGSAMDMEGYLRIGYANNEGIPREGLRRVSAFLREKRVAAA